MEEIFVLWQPVLTRVGQRGVKLTCLLTPLTALVPVASMALPEYLLERLSLKGKVVRWQLKPCLTDYTTPPEDLGSERARWRQAWVIEMELENSSTELILKHESFFIKEGRIGEHNGEKSEAGVPYLVVADFADEGDRKGYVKFVQEVLPAQAFEMLMTELTGPELTVYQVRLEVKAERLKAIDRIERECSKYQGYTNFTLRVDEADEIYNADGVD